MGESAAIMRYLANSRPDEIDQRLYPHDALRIRAKIDELLDWNHVGLRQGTNRLCYLKYFSFVRKEPHLSTPALLKQVEFDVGKSLDYLDYLLSSNHFLSCGHLTLADFAAFSDVS